MLNHLSFATADLLRAGAFYDAVMPAIGFRRVCDGTHFIGYGPNDGEDGFSVKLRPAPISIPGDGFHLAFTAPSRAAVDAFYAAALAHDGKDNGGFGLHPEYGDNYYAAFVFDPDGYRLEAVCHGPA